MKVLYIGNSYTHCNDLPGMIKSFGQVDDPVVDIAWEMQTPGGCTFEKHIKDGEAVKLIRRGGWDWVVLQEQSLRPLEDPDLMRTYALELQQEINKTGAAILLYMTWARRDQPEQTKGFIKQYTGLAAEMGVKVAPAGQAWAALRDQHPEMPMYVEDGSHPTLQGSFLSANVLYQAMVGRPAPSIELEGLPKEEEAILQRISREVFERE